MFRVAIFFDGGVDEAEELTACIADLMHDHTAPERDRAKLGYVVALAALDEPDDADEFITLVMDAAYMAFLGPRNDDE